MFRWRIGNCGGKVILSLLPVSFTFLLAFVVSYSTYLWSLAIHQTLFSRPDYVYMCSLIRVWFWCSPVVKLLLGGPRNNSVPGVPVLLLFLANKHAGHRSEKMGKRSC